MKTLQRNHEILSTYRNHYELQSFKNTSKCFRHWEESHLVKIAMHIDTLSLEGVLKNAQASNENEVNLTAARIPTTDRADDPYCESVIETGSHLQS